MRFWFICIGLLLAVAYLCAPTLKTQALDHYLKEVNANACKALCPHVAFEKVQMPVHWSSNPLVNYQGKAFMKINIVEFIDCICDPEDPELFEYLPITLWDLLKGERRVQIWMHAPNHDCYLVKIPVNMKVSIWNTQTKCSSKCPARCYCKQVDVF